MANKKGGIQERLLSGALTAVFALIVGLFVSGTALAETEEAPASGEETKAESPKPAEQAASEPTGAHCHIKAYKKVACHNPHAACAESEQVIETLKEISHLYSEGKFDEFAKFLDDGVTTFDEKGNKLIIGKEAVLTDIRKRWDDAHASGSPITSFTINHPYAKVTGDQAVVTFEGVKTIGGKNPETLVSRSTDIFVKKDGVWKKLHYRSCWKKGKPAAGPT